MMINKKVYIFKETIGILELPDYTEMSTDIKPNGTIVFDLSGTKEIHSSLIGLLIEIKNTISPHNGCLLLLLSSAVAKTMIMLNVFSYFSNCITTDIAILPME